MPHRAFMASHYRYAFPVYYPFYGYSLEEVLGEKYLATQLNEQLGEYAKIRLVLMPPAQYLELAGVGTTRARCIPLRFDKVLEVRTRLENETALNAIARIHGEVGVASMFLLAEIDLESPAQKPAGAEDLRVVLDAVQELSGGVEFSISELTCFTPNEIKSSVIGLISERHGFSEAAVIVNSGVETLERLIELWDREFIELREPELVGA